MSFVKRVLTLLGILLITGFLIQYLFDPLASYRNQKKLNVLQSELTKAKSKWGSRNIMDYSFEMKRWFPSTHCYAKVTVHQGEISAISAMYLPILAGMPAEGSLTKLEKQEWDDEPCRYSQWTIPKILDQVQWFIDHKKNITSLAFDPELGFVTELRGDDNFNRGFLVPGMFDTEFRYTFSNFQRLASSTLNKTKQVTP